MRRHSHPAAAVVVPVGIQVDPVVYLPKPHQGEFMPVVMPVRIPVMPYSVKPPLAPGQSVIYIERES